MYDHAGTHTCSYNVHANTKCYHGLVTPVSKRSNHFSQLNVITNKQHRQRYLTQEHARSWKLDNQRSDVTHTECSHLVDGQKAVGDKIGYERDEQHWQEVVAKLVVTLLVQHKARCTLSTPTVKQATVIKVKPMQTFHPDETAHVHTHNNPNS